MIRFPLRSNSKKSGLIALSFDDGPSPPATGRILEILDRYQLRATFFVIGARLEKHPELGRELLSRGHQIANHGMRHRWLTAATSSIWGPEVKKAEEIIRTVCGVTPRFYRPPRGLYRRAMMQELVAQGYYPTLWTAMPGDYFFWHSANSIQKKLAHLPGGSVIVLHDGVSLRPNPDRALLLTALPKVIENLLDKGYHFATLSELFELPAYFAALEEPQTR